MRGDSSTHGFTEVFKKMTTEDKSKFKMSEEERKAITGHLENQFHVNDHLFDCVVRLSTSFAEALKMNSCMCSCLSIEKHTVNWGDKDRDGRGIDRG